MYEPQASVEELSAFGLLPTDYDDEAFSVWPENHKAFSIFVQLRTQWRSSGMAGPTGLDYSVLYPLLDRKAKDESEWELLLDDVQEMELAALAAMHPRKG